MDLEKNSAWQRYRKTGRDAVKKHRLGTESGRLRIDKLELIGKQFDFNT